MAVQEVFRDKHWKFFKINALKKNKNWDIMSLPRQKKQWGANVFSQSNTRWMGHWIGIRLD